MNNDVLESITDIDAQLDAEFGSVANETDENQIETDNNDTGMEDNVDNTAGLDGEQEKEEEKDIQTQNQPQDKEPQVQDNTQVDKTKSDEDGKSHHAFADLRKQNSDLRKEKEALIADSAFLKELASSYGYTDTKQFVQAYKDAKIKKEAETKGYDPELYRQTIEQRERIEALERQREQDIQTRQLATFKSVLDEAAVKYNVSQEEIFDRLDKSGLDANTILAIHNPKLLIDGLLVDKIQENAKQSQINTMKNLQDFSEGKNEDGGNAKGITIDSLLKDDLAKYKADNFFE